MFRFDPRNLATDVTVLGTWLGGVRVDLDAYIGESKTIDHSTHGHLRSHKRHVC